MYRMFYVRFRLHLLPTLPSWATRTCRVRCCRFALPSVCHISVPRGFPLPVAPPLDSAGCDCFQPAAEL
jgi:hypothetical protein